jgi:hypothetical protein
MLMTGLQEANTYAQGGVTIQDQQILQETIVGKKSRRRVLPVPEALELRKAYQSEHPDIVLPNEFPTEITEVARVELAGRPRYRRIVTVGSPWEVNIESERTAAEREQNPEVAHVGRIFSHTPVAGSAAVIWVQLNWLELHKPKKALPKALGCPVYRRSDGEERNKWQRLVSPSTLLLPVHLMHCCTEECGAGLAGSIGYKATVKGGRHVVQMGDLFVRNPWFLK